MREVLLMRLAVCGLVLWFLLGLVGALRIFAPPGCTLEPCTVLVGLASPGPHRFVFALSAWWLLLVGSLIVLSEQREHRRALKEPHKHS